VLILSTRLTTVLLRPLTRAPPGRPAKKRKRRGDARKPSACEEFAIQSYMYSWFSLILKIVGFVSLTKNSTKIRHFCGGYMLRNISDPGVSDKYHLQRRLSCIITEQNNLHVGGMVHRDSFFNIDSPRSTMIGHFLC
jgi:hypothetical protein